MTNDPAWWQGLAELLPPALAAEVMEGWSIGEQEGALDHLVSSLLDLDIAIGDGDRVRLAVTAEDWGERVALESRILQCPARPDGHADGGAAGVRLIDQVDAEPLPGSAFGHLGSLEELLVVPWIACMRCGRVLGRAHRREPWGGLSYLAAHYVLYQPGRPEPAALAGPSAGEALAALSRCAAPEPSPD